MKQTNCMRASGAPPVEVIQTLVPPLAFSDVAGACRKERRYVSRRELRALFPVSDMTIWRWMRDPEVAFPRPTKLGRNGRNFWWLPEILEWERRRTTGSSVKREHDIEPRRATRGGRQP